MAKYPYIAWLVRFIGAVLFFVGMGALGYSLWIGASFIVAGIVIAASGNHWFKKQAGWRGQSW